MQARAHRAHLGRVIIISLERTRARTRLTDDGDYADAGTPRVLWRCAFLRAGDTSGHLSCAQARTDIITSQFRMCLSFNCAHDLCERCANIVAPMRTCGRRIGRSVEHTNGPIRQYPRHTRIASKSDRCRTHITYRIVPGLWPMPNNGVS